jgi:glycosyltransferase involved in cell wall biosynthesis
MTRRPEVLIVSLSAPELDRIAVDLAARQSLLGIVRRYANKGRAWERSILKLPWLGGSYASTFGRRLPPAGIDSRFVIEAGIGSDFLAALLNRAGRRVPGLVTPLSRRLLHRTEFSVARRARRYVRDAAVVVGSYHVARPALGAARRAGIPTVLNYPIAHHRWQYQRFSEQAEANPEFAAALPSFGDTERHAATLDREISLADSILVGSSFARDTFVSQGVPTSKIKVIPYGVDAQRFAPAAEPRGGKAPFRVLFVGQLGERKGLSYLLRAYEAFRKPDTELLLVGDFVNGREVYRRFDGMFSHVPNVPQTRLPAIFRSADVFVLPTLVEGMPLVVLEAMASGVPVVVTPNGPTDVVRDGLDGYIVRSCDSMALTERLEELYRNPDRRAEMGRNARRRAEQWTWGRYTTAAAEFVLDRARGVS